LDCYEVAEVNNEQNALLIFGEELGELAAELLKLQNQVSKAIRFGIDEIRDLPTTNRERIEAEWNDLLGALINLAERGIELQPNAAAIAAKLGKIERYTSYSQQLGTVQTS
jgi:NTP pyrophosphatase (non-canonical NTP hydrolase)